MDEERDARREAVAIIDKILREPRMDPRDQLVKDLRTQLEVLGLEDELERFSWRSSRSDLIEQFEYFKLKIKMGDYPEKWERRRQRKAFDHEQFEERVSEFRSRDRKEIKALETEVAKLKLKREKEALKPERSETPFVAILIIGMCIVAAVICLLVGNGGNANFGRAGRVLTNGLWQLLELAAGVGVVAWIVVMMFKTVSAPKKKRE